MQPASEQRPPKKTRAVVAREKVPHLWDALRIQKSKEGSRNERRSLLPYNECCVQDNTAGSFSFEKKRATEREGEESVTQPQLEVVQ